MTSLLYDASGSLLAVAFGVGGAVLAVLGALREDGFLTGRYLKWLAILVAWAIAAPFLYMWQTHPIGYADAALLRVRIVGWADVLIAYSALSGLIVGGVIGVAVRRVKGRAS